MDVGQRQQPHLARDVVQFGFERNGVEVDAVGDADGLLSEDLLVVGEGDDAVHLAGQAAAEQPVDLQLALLLETCFAELGVVGIGGDFEGNAHSQPMHAAQPCDEQRIGVQVVADVEKLHPFAADVTGDVGVGDAFEHLGAKPAPEGADHLVARQPPLRAVRTDLQVAQRDLCAAPAESLALGENLLRDAAVGRESVEYDEQSFHGGLFSGRRCAASSLRSYTPPSWT